MNHRLYRCHWKGDEIIKTPIIVNDGTYIRIPENQFKPVDKMLANDWFEEYPYKWYEFYRLINFFRKIRNKIKHRYAKNRIIKSALYDLIILIITYIIGAYIYDNFIK